MDIYKEQNVQLIIWHVYRYMRANLYRTSVIIMSEPGEGF